MSKRHLKEKKLVLRGLGIRQEDLADVAGVSRFTVTKYLNDLAHWEPGDSIRRIERAIELLRGLEAAELLDPKRRQKLLVSVARQVEQSATCPSGKAAPEGGKASARASGGGRPSGPDPKRRSRPKYTVLVADDEETVRRVVQYVLTNAGYEVLAAADGVEGLELVTRHEGPVHLILSDVVMPRLRGPEMVERLRRARPGVPVLYLSGSFDEDGIPDPQDAETAWLPKPFTPQELLEKVDLMIGNSS
ncbi:MAG: response regulator [Deltaproteobacteria bacterium]|nr:response regulator [Deltaproteobacteria bacterium]